MTEKSRFRWKLLFLVSYCIWKAHVTIGGPWLERQEGVRAQPSPPHSPRWSTKSATYWLLLYFRRAHGSNNWNHHVSVQFLLSNTPTPHVALLILTGWEKNVHFILIIKCSDQLASISINFWSSEKLTARQTLQWS